MSPATWTVHEGRAEEVLPGMAENSLDACITDPPYGLSKEPDAAEVLRHWLAGDPYVHKQTGFMGQSWDSLVPGPEYWRAVFRALKPGAHLLAFAGTRTWDLMSVAIRLAGFECRDTIQHNGVEAIRWTYASGFPKSLDVSAAIDREAGVERPIIGPLPRAATPGPARTMGRPNGAQRGWQEAPMLTAPATEAAAAWAGFGTALKPSWEPILVFRKPLSEATVAANVLRWGTGAVNVDAGRISHDEPCRPIKANTPAGLASGFHQGGRYKDTTELKPAGRWPANTILSCPGCPDGEHLDGCPVGELDRQSGHLKSGARKGPRNKTSDTGWGHGSIQLGGPCEASEGGASRFFFVAKPAKSEREAGVENVPALFKLREDLTPEQREYVLSELTRSGVAL